MTKHPTQRDAILALLNVWPCSPSTFMRAGIAQYNTRIHELRAMWYDIRKVSDKYVKQGNTMVRHTTYQLF